MRVSVVINLIISCFHFYCLTISCLLLLKFQKGFYLSDTAAPKFATTIDFCDLMDGKHFLLFSFLQWMMNTGEVFTNEGNSISSRSVYIVTQENVRLTGHVVKRFESTSLPSCSHACVKSKWCTSTNFKLSPKKDAKGTCELNKHDISLVNENTAFHKQENVTFSMSFKVNTVTYKLIKND